MKFWIKWKQTFSYLDDVLRISASSYIPNDEDLLRSRAATCGIIEIEFPYRNIHLKYGCLNHQNSKFAKVVFNSKKANLLVKVGLYFTTGKVTVVSKLIGWFWLFWFLFFQKNFHFYFCFMIFGLKVWNYNIETLYLSLLEEENIWWKQEIKMLIECQRVEIFNLNI